MSWYSGAQDMKRSPAPMSMRCWMAASLAMRLPWLTITPLGAEVEPEVYCRKAMSSAAGAWGRQASASARSTWSAATAAMLPKRASAPGRACITSAVLITQAASASPTMPSSRSRCCTRSDSSGGTGTAITPA